MTRRIKNPYIIMPLITCSIVLSWIGFSHFTSMQGAAFDTVDKNINMLKNNSFESWEDEKISDWKIASHGATSYSTSRQHGYVNGSGLQITTTDTSVAKGYVSLESSQINVTPGSYYDYKMFYLTDTAIDLMVKETSMNGAVKTTLLKQYPDYDYPWSAMGSKVKTNHDTTSMQIVIHMHGEGSLELDEGYVISSNTPSTNNKASVDTPNLIAHAPREFKKTEGTASSGEQKDAHTYTTTVQANPTPGQSGWATQPVPASEHASYEYSFTYQSSAEVVVGVDYVTQAGSYKYERILALSPSEEPISHKIIAETPRDITSIQPSLQISGAGTLEVKDESLRMIGEPQKFDTPIVSITFDDGLFTSYSNGARLLQEYDMQGTFYINPGLINSSRYMRDLDLKDLLKNKHQLGSHTYTHIDLTSLHHDELKKEFTKSNDYLKKLGVKKIDFASPYGKYDDMVYPLLKRDHRSHRSTEPGVNTKQNFDQHKLYGYFVRKSTTEQDLRDQLEYAQSKSGWLILIYHDIEVTTSPFSIDAGTLERHLQIVKESKLPVMTVERALQTLSN